MSTIGSGTMVADGLSIMNADFSSTSFRVSRVSIGPHNFVGNNIAYPAGGRTGENCLLATKAMIPLDGEIREGVGLLGSPCFEIPRSVERDSRFDHLRTGDELRRRLRAKNRHNLRTMGVSCWRGGCICSWSPCSSWLPSTSTAGSRSWRSPRPVRAQHPDHPGLLRAGGTRPQGIPPAAAEYCSIYDPYFWRHERLWKVPGEAYLHMFDGTPFKNLIWRGLGVRIGRRVFDDGCYLTSGRWPRSATTARSTRAARSSATRRRTARSSPTGSRSVPAAPSGSAPWSTTA